jgi:hypothetical protein
VMCSTPETRCGGTIENIPRGILSMTPCNALDGVPSDPPTPDVHRCSAMPFLTRYPNAVRSVGDIGESR